MVTSHPADKLKDDRQPFEKAESLAIRSRGIYLSLQRSDIWLLEAGDEYSFMGGIWSFFGSSRFKRGCDVNFVVCHCFLV